MANKCFGVGTFGSADPGLNGYRLTLASATPVPTSDLTAQGTLYLTPYKHNRIALYNGTSWEVFDTGEVSISLTGISTTAPTDVFGIISSGALALELLVWTNDTTRATGLTRQDGVWTKTGDATRRYLGTIYGSAANVCEDSTSRRYVWNADNRVSRNLFATDSTDSWTYTTAAWREANGGSTIGTTRVALVRGLNEDLVTARVVGVGVNASTVGVAVGVGIDSTTVNSAQVRGGALNNSRSSIVGFYSGFPAIGFHTISWLENSQAAGTTTWLGDNGGSANGDMQCGIVVEVQG
jgi:hypothetical protein